MDIQKDRNPVSEIHAKHHKGAMGKIDDLHHPKDQVQTDSNQCIDPPHKESANDGLNQNVGIHPCSLSEIC
jgi:hypothetical protein